MGGDERGHDRPRRLVKEQAPGAIEGIASGLDSVKPSRVHDDLRVLVLMGLEVGVAERSVIKAKAVRDDE